MKEFKMKILLVLLTVLLYGLSEAQTNNHGIDYQGILRDDAGNLVSNQTVNFELRILSDSLNGGLEFSEKHLISTNGKGHFKIVIGTGQYLNGTATELHKLDWQKQMFLNVRVDIQNSGSYKEIGTTQFGVVPFSFLAYKTSQKFDINELSDVDTSGVKNGYVLKWDNGKWRPSLDSVLAGRINPDTVNFANYGHHSITSDSALFATNCINVIPSDTANFSSKGDSANYSDTAKYSLFSQRSKLADTANLALYAKGFWSIHGDSNLSNSKLGHKDNKPLVFITNDTERVRIDTNGFLGIGTNSPLADIHVEGSNGVLFTGAFAPNAPSIRSGAANTFFYYPAKAAFRAGEISGNHWDNFRLGHHSFAGGQNTIASGNRSMAFGYGSQAYAEASVALGFICKTYGFGSFAAANNCVSYGAGSISMGRSATAYDSASVALGYTLVARGKSSIATGFYTQTNADFCVVMGSYSKADHSGSFVYTDASKHGTYFSTTAANQFRVKASGGTYLYSNSNATTGVRLASGSGSWSSLSDRRSKNNIEEIDYIEILNSLNSVDVYTWNYKSQDSTIRHMGPMAQDFYSAFKLGESERHISTVDIDGVNMAAIKGLQMKLAKMEKYESEVASLKDQVNYYKERQKVLESKIQEFEQYFLKAEK